MAVLAPSRSARSVIDAGDTESLRKLLASEPGVANAPLRTGSGDVLPPIAYVISLARAGRCGGQTADLFVDILLEAGADPSALVNDLGDSLLIHAAHNGCSDIGMRLLVAGADIHAHGKFGATALHWAAQEGQTVLVDALIDTGLDPAETDRQWRGDALYWAIYGWVGRRALQRRHQPRVIRRLLARGAEVTGRHRVLMSLDEGGTIRDAIGESAS